MQAQLTVKLFVICGLIPVALGGFSLGILLNMPFEEGIGSPKISFNTIEASSPGHCAIICKRDPRCFGFNVANLSSNTVLCDFKAETHFPVDFVSMPGSRFYQIAEESFPYDCQDLLKSGEVATSGMYDVSIMGDPGSKQSVYCDMTTDGGGWNVVLRRQDGSENFERSWAEYKAGFGTLSGEFWAGNDELHRLTSNHSEPYCLQVDMVSFSGDVRFAEYSTFMVGPEDTEYVLSVAGYSGDAGDSLGAYDGIKFSTYDRRNDNANYNCADKYHSGWWYDDCSGARLTGLWGQDVRDDYYFLTIYTQGIIWVDWLGMGDHPQFVEMKIKPCSV